MSSRVRILILLIFLVAAGAAGTVVCWQWATPPIAETPVSPAARKEQIAQFCGACHRMPSPDQFPRDSWHREVERGFQFYTDSGRTDLNPPPMQVVVEWFQSQAPEALALPKIENSDKPAPVRFRIAHFATGKESTEPLGCTISAVTWLRPRPQEPGELICSDMRNGQILKVGLGPESLTANVVAKFAHPATVRTCDLDRDGKTDWVIADLGSFTPQDHDQGAVWWLRPSEVAQGAVPLLTGVGRVASAEPVDADGDGDQDLIVAEFGWHKTGGIHLLENQGLQGGQLLVKRHLLDPRPGTIQTPIFDFNLDGRPDFLALIAQEHETVSGFLNQSQLQFQSREFDAPQDPAYGYSGLSLVDLDGDGDQDVLVTNGDSFDSFYVKPVHSVQWLENHGNLRFERHFITAFPGVLRAVAGDLDGDGDMDIVAGALLPAELRSDQPRTDFDSLILLEQTAKGQFTRYRLEAGQCHHAAIEIADFDDDGDLDLAVGNFTQVQEDNLPAVTVWWNLLKDDASSRTSADR